MVEHLKVLISRAPKGPYGRAPKGPYGRAPKGDGGLISRACLRILISRAPCRVRVYLLGAPSQISNQRATKVPCTRKRKPLRDLYM